jgi:hypothetical protein
MYPAVLTRMALGWRTALSLELPLFLFATVSVLLFYATAVAGARGRWTPWMGYFPAVMSVAIGLSINNSRAIFEALGGRQTPFLRTPKYDIRGRGDTARGKVYRSRLNWTVVLELALAAHFAGMLHFVIDHGLFGAIPFVLLFLFGYAYVGLSSLAHPLRPS